MFSIFPRAPQSTDCQPPAFTCPVPDPLGQCLEVSGHCSKLAVTLESRTMETHSRSQREDTGPHAEATTSRLSPKTEQ
jgi:hypothetical protein